MEGHKHSTHKISDLIELLTKIKDENGDLDIIYWDQFSTVRFKNPNDILEVKNTNLYFGGFHVVANRFCQLDEHVGEEDGVCDIDDY